MIAPAVLFTLINLGGDDGALRGWAVPTATDIAFALLVQRGVRAWWVLLPLAGATWWLMRFTRARLAEGLSWWDVLGLAMLGGIGFTVSLLIGELAYGSGTARDDQAKTGVLLGSLTAALLAAVVLRLRNRHYRRLHADETEDRDADGIPDAYQRDELRP